MGKSLVIVESPAKSKTIVKFLGKDYTVKASMGHVIDLPTKKLGIDVDNNFEPEYVTMKGKQKVLDELKTAAKKVDAVYLAPDPDREGEAIAWHIYNFLKKFFKGEIYRVSFNEITKKAIQESIKNPGRLNMDKVNAQQARRILDRIVGYKLSPFLWKSIGRGLSAGRVQSVAVLLICKREEEIEAFIIKEYWTIDTLLNKKDTLQEIKARLDKKDGKKLEIENQEQSDAIVSDLEGEKFIVNSVKKKEKKRNPFPPFKTSLLQQNAAQKLGFTASRTMSAAQQLYEGVDISGEGSVGLITYMRTDSFRISNDAIAEVRDFITDKYGKEYLPEKPRFYASKKKTQDAHEAIRPTSVLNEPDKIKEYLSSDQYKLYKLIWDRFVSSQMESARYNMTGVEIGAGAYLLRLSGSQIKFEGYLKVLGDVQQKKKKKDDDENLEGEEASEDNILPEFTEGEELDFKKCLPEQHFTKPPARYSEATLVKALEENGIGRPSTYAPTLKTIEARSYVEKIEKRFHPTDLGKKVTDVLVKFFDDIIQIKFTAEMEDILDNIEEGNQDWVKILKDFYTPLEKKLTAIKPMLKDIKKAVIETDEVCDECGAGMVLKVGKYGQFFACSKYPECKFTKEKDDEELKNLPPEVLDAKCDKCKSDMVVKRGKFGQFLACTKYPECKSTKPILIKTGVACPEIGCSGELVKRKSQKRKKYFYGCSKYPDCKFITNKLEKLEEK